MCVFACRLLLACVYIWIIAKFLSSLTGATKPLDLSLIKKSSSAGGGMAVMLGVVERNHLADNVIKGHWAGDEAELRKEKGIKSQFHLKHTPKDPLESEVHLANA